MTSADYSSYIPIDEAAARLGVSARTIRRRGVEIVKRNGRAVCNPDDIEKLRPAAHVMPEGSAALVRLPEKSPVPGALDIVAAFATLARPEARQKPWLTIREAAEYIGLSTALIKRERRAGRLEGVKDPKWKISRQSLDGWRPKEKTTGVE